MNCNLLSQLLMMMMSGQFGGNQVQNPKTGAIKGALFAASVYPI